MPFEILWEQRKRTLVLTGSVFLVCLNFCCRYLPSEIGCLKNLEYLDLSFNKMKSLPNEISNLSVLISLKVSNNKLVELPPSLSSLLRLKSLDLSNNRLTSLGSLDLGSMNNLQNLNLQVLTFFCNLVWLCQVFLLSYKFLYSLH